MSSNRMTCFATFKSNGAFSSAPLISSRSSEPNATIKSLNSWIEYNRGLFVKFVMNIAYENLSIVLKARSSNGMVCNYW